MTRFWKLLIAAMLPLTMAFAACGDDDGVDTGDLPGVEDDGNGVDDTFGNDDDTFGTDDTLDTDDDTF